MYPSVRGRLPAPGTRLASRTVMPQPTLTPQPIVTSQPKDRPTPPKQGRARKAVSIVLGLLILCLLIELGSLLVYVIYAQEMFSYAAFDKRRERIAAGHAIGDEADIGMLQRLHSIIHPYLGFTWDIRAREVEEYLQVHNVDINPWGFPGPQAVIRCAIRMSCTADLHSSITGVRPARKVRR